MYKLLIRPVLFMLPAEKAHHFTFSLLGFLHRIPGISALVRSLFVVNDKSLERSIDGLTFPNPVGLAAGFDKDAKLYKELASFGFGHIEIGTLTPKAQPGNDLPRLFRLPNDKGLINRMGFNNGGVESAIERLKSKPKNLIVGGNIGKNKATANEDALSDYEHCFRALYPYLDYFVVNVSSPNTFNLRALQDKEPLKNILSRLQEIRKAQNERKPLFLKIAPDLTPEQLDDIVEIFFETGISGVIATNTTISREGLSYSKEHLDSIGAGGLSGAPVRERSTEVVRYLTEKSGGEMPIIAVGGIMSAEDAMEKLNAGAMLVQLYTGFIYEGPALVKRINKRLLKK
jgi:dihydroorotate dehydrogenase